MTKPFSQKQLLDRKQLAQDFKIMAAYASDMFPSHRDWAMVIASLDDRQPHTKPSAENLPFHTRDDEWLTKYVAKVLREHGQGAIKKTSVRRFVEDSVDFNLARTKYEQNLTKGQIQFLLNNYHNKIVPTEFLPNQMGEVAYDKAFRAGVLDEMKLLGVDQHNAELGLEKNADLWREHAMITTFRNEVCPDLVGLGDHFFPERDDAAQLRTYQDTWVKLREADYYRAHKAVVDEAESHTDNMLISPSAASDLLHTVIKLAEEHTRTHAAGLEK